MTTAGYLFISKEAIRPTSEDIICVTCSAYVHSIEGHNKWHADGQPMTAEDKQEVMDWIRKIIAEQGPPQTTDQGLRWAVPVILLDPSKCYHPEE